MQSNTVIEDLGGKSCPSLGTKQSSNTRRSLYIPLESSRRNVYHCCLAHVGTTNFILVSSYPLYHILNKHKVGESVKEAFPQFTRKASDMNKLSVPTLEQNGRHFVLRLVANRCMSENPPRLNMSFITALFSGYLYNSITSLLS